MHRLLFALAMLFTVPLGHQAPESPQSHEQGDVRAFYGGTDLQSYLSQPDGSMGDALSLGYVTGVADELANKGLICPSEQVTTGEVRDVVKKYFEDHSLACLRQDWGNPSSCASPASCRPYS